MIAHHRDVPRNAVFVDTSALYAFADRNDKHHRAVRAAYRTLEQDRRSLVTTNFTLLELHSLITNRMYASIATETLFDIEDSDIVVVRVEPDDELQARQILRQYTDKGFSLLDATSFAVMERLNLDTALSFDRHFTQYGLTVLT